MFNSKELEILKQQLKEKHEIALNAGCNDVELPETEENKAFLELASEKGWGTRIEFRPVRGKYIANDTMIIDYLLERVNEEFSQAIQFEALTALLALVMEQSKKVSYTNIDAFRLLLNIFTISNLQQLYNKPFPLPAEVSIDEEGSIKLKWTNGVGQLRLKIGENTESSYLFWKENAEDEGDTAQYVNDTTIAERFEWLLGENNI